MIFNITDTRSSSVDAFSSSSLYLHCCVMTKQISVTNNDMFSKKIQDGFEILEDVPEALRKRRSCSLPTSQLGTKLNSLTGELSCHIKQKIYGSVTTVLCVLFVCRRGLLNQCNLVAPGWFTEFTWNAVIHFSILIGITGLVVHEEVL